MAEHAFNLDSPTAVGAYAEACEAGRTAGLRAIADAEALGGNDGPAVSRGMWNHADEITGLFAAKDNTPPPAGWVYVARHETLRPARGKAGNAARTWIADHPLTADARATLADTYGLPHYSRTYADGLRYRIARPHVFQYAGALWARYQGDIDGDCLWTPQPLSAFYTALEAAQAEQEATSRG